MPHIPLSTLYSNKLNLTTVAVTQVNCRHSRKNQTAVEKNLTFCFNRGVTFLWWRVNNTQWKNKQTKKRNITQDYNTFTHLKPYPLTEDRPGCRLSVFVWQTAETAKRKWHMETRKQESQTHIPCSSAHTQTYSTLIYVHRPRTSHWI